MTDSSSRPNVVVLAGLTQMLQHWLTLGHLAPPAWGPQLKAAVGATAAVAHRIANSSAGRRSGELFMLLISRTTW